MQVKSRACNVFNKRLQRLHTDVATPSAGRVHPRIAAALTDAAELLPDTVPAMSKLPKLRSRRMRGEIGEVAWETVAGAARHLELVSAAAIDRHGIAGPAVMAVTAGLLTAMVRGLGQ